MPLSGSVSFVVVLAVSVSSLKLWSLAGCFESGAVGIPLVQVGSMASRLPGARTLTAASSCTMVVFVG